MEDEKAESRQSAEHSSLDINTDDKAEDAAAAGQDVDNLQSSAISTPPKSGNEDDWEYPGIVTTLLANVAVTLVCFLMLLDNSILSTAIPRITNQFHSLDDIGWYGSAYLMTSCACGPLAGKFYKRFSSKYTFSAFVATFELGSLLCGVATSSKMLIVGRAVAGIGGSGIVNGALTIISACVPLHKRAAFLGFMMSFGQMGVLLGPLIGGLFTEYATWRWCFYINLPIGGVAILFILFINIPERRKKVEGGISALETLKSLDLVGFAIFVPAIIQILLALEYGGNQYAWNSSVVIGLFCGGPATLVLFCFWEQRMGDNAMVPLNMIRKRIVWMSCATIFFLFANMLTLSYYMAIYFQAVTGVSPTTSGIHFLPTVLSQIVFSLTSGILVARIGYYLPFVITAGVLSAISTGLISTLGPTSSMGLWIGYQILGGAGRGCGIQMPIVAIQNNITPEENPVGMALVAFAQNFGGALFLAFDQVILSSSLQKGLQEFAPEVNVAAVMAAGATGFRTIVSPASLAGVVKAYDYAFSHVMYLATGAAAGAFVVSWGLGWKSVKKAKVVAPEA